MAVRIVANAGSAIQVGTILLPNGESSSTENPQAVVTEASGDLEGSLSVSTPAFLRPAEGVWHVSWGCQSRPADPLAALKWNRLCEKRELVLVAGSAAV